MDGLTDYHTKWNKSEKDKYYDITHPCNLIKKNNINELISRTETDSQILKITLWLPKGKHQGEREIRHTTAHKTDKHVCDIHTPLHIK